MKASLLVIALFATTAGIMSQQGTVPNVPALRPQITELGTIRDTTVNGDMLPQTVALSPNGSMVLYQTNKDLRIWNSRTRSNASLLTGWVDNAVWSPTGDAIAFARSSEQGPHDFLWSMRLDPATGRAVGTAQRVSLSPITGNAPQFSPDGKFIAYPRRDDGPQWSSSLVVVPAAGGAERVLTSGFHVRSLAWSSDGASIYFVASTDSTRSKPMLYRIPMSGGSRQLVYSSPGASVMTDGRLMLSYQDSLGKTRSAFADAAGKPIARLTPVGVNQWGDWCGCYRRSGTKEFYPRGLRVTDIASGASRMVIDTTVESGPPTWFPDGRRLAAITKADGARALVIINADGSGMRKIPLTVIPQLFGTLVGFMAADLRISPDSRYAMYLSEDRVSLELVDLTSGRQRTLVRPDFSVGTAYWSSDSRSIRYVRDGGSTNVFSTRAVHEVQLDGTDKLVRSLSWAEFPFAAVPLVNFNHVVVFGEGPRGTGGATNYTLVPLDGGAPRVLLPTPAFGGQVSPDGRTLAVRAGFSTRRAAAPTRRITFISLTDASRREVDLPFTDVPFAGMQFHSNNNVIFVAGRESLSDPVVFYSVPVDGSAPRVVGRSETREAVSLFSVSPDAKYIAYTLSGAPRSTFVSVDYTASLASLLRNKPSRR